MYPYGYVICGYIVLSVSLCIYVHMYADYTSHKGVGLSCRFDVPALGTELSTMSLAVLQLTAGGGILGEITDTLPYTNCS